MIDDIVLQEVSDPIRGCEPDVASAHVKEGAGQLRSPRLEQNAAHINTPPWSDSGIVVQQKNGLDVQQMNDLKIQIETMALVARVCQRLR